MEYIFYYNETMIETAPTYLFYRFFYRIKSFLTHWYIRSGRLYWHFVINKLEKLDYYLAWKITFKYLFKPLYKDYSPLGYLLGFILRSGRLILATLIYLLILTAAGIGYLLWLVFPPFVLYQALFS